MKGFLITLIVMILLPSIAFSSLTGEIRLSLIEGDVQLRPEGTDDWFPASINTPVLEGDRLWVPERGRLEMQLRDGSFVRLKESTSLNVLRIEDSTLQFYINSGSVYINFTGRKRYLQFDTPNSSVRVYERARFRIDVYDDGRVDVSTYNGTVYVESFRGRNTVRGGDMISIRGEEYAELSPLGPSDEWERWNRERDRRLTERGYSYRYLPDELRPYSYDFDENGRWVYVKEYGYVWTPTVYVSVGWAPYRHGRWVWIGGDYVWVSYEPWGWVPYHYGRWAFVVSVGWCWVPPARGAVYWGPGFVGWVYTPTYVAWVPLAPGEIYYGYGYYGPHSVNIINIDIHKVVVKEYKHAHIRDAITTVHRDTFLKGKPVEINVRENPFLTHKIHIGRPPIEPLRETRAPIIKEIIRDKEPPVRIRELDIKRLREHRPIVKERDISVMRPGERLKESPIDKLRKPLRPEEKPIRPSEDRGPFFKRTFKRKEEGRGTEGFPLKPPKSMEEKRLRGQEERRPEKREGPDKMKKILEDKNKSDKIIGGSEPARSLRPIDKERGPKEQGSSKSHDIRKILKGKDAMQKEQGKESPIPELSDKEKGERNIMKGLKKRD